jgi:hypothetical protein
MPPKYTSVTDMLAKLKLAPAKKSPAKKSPAKKSPAKKSPAKKSPAALSRPVFIDAARQRYLQTEVKRGKSRSQAMAEYDVIERDELARRRALHNRDSERFVRESLAAGIPLKQAIENYMMRQNYEEGGEFAYQAGVPMHFRRPRHH